MGLILLALFIGVPIAEIALFIAVGEQIGILATIGIVIATAIAGTALVRHQGFSTLQKARAEMDQNRLPADQMAEGLAILVAGVLLLTPGFLTDAMGFALLIPPVRRAIIAFVGKSVAARFTVVDMPGDIRGGTVHGSMHRGPTRSGPSHSGPGRPASRGDDVIDGEAVEIDPDETNQSEASRGEASQGEAGGAGPKPGTGSASPWRQ